MYKIVPHTADVALAVDEKNLVDIFKTAAMGWKYLVVENASTRPAERRMIELTAPGIEELLVDWLSELNFFLTAEFWLLDAIDSLSLAEHEQGYKLNAAIDGEPIDPDRHHIEMDIKAVTFHQLAIRHEAGVYETTIVFDI